MKNLCRTVMIVRHININKRKVIHMKKFPVGMQVYSVRYDAEKDFKGTMQTLKDIGYDFVELAGLYGLTAAQIKAALDEVGIPCYSMHIPYADLVADLDKQISDALTIGSKFIVVPYMTEENRPGVENYDEVIASIERIGKKCRENGITLLYHNHDFEFVTMPDGRYGLDVLYASVPADYLQTELDTCWVRVAGESPDGYVRKYANRCPIVHLKDYEGEKSEHMYDLIGIKSEKKEGEVSSFRFRPVGYGVQDFKAIITAAEESGAEYIVVEQDESPDRPALESAKMSRDYLRTIGQ